MKTLQQQMRHVVDHALHPSYIYFRRPTKGESTIKQPLYSRLDNNAVTFSSSLYCMSCIYVRVQGRVSYFMAEVQVFHVDRILVHVLQYVDRVSQSERCRTR